MRFKAWLFAVLTASLTAAIGHTQTCPPIDADCPSSPSELCELEQETGAIDASDYNILLIVLDDLGCDKLAMYEQTPYCAPGENPCYEEFPETPYLDSLRACGTMFTNCYVNPMCSPTRATIQTGRYSFRTGVYNQINGNQAPVSMTCSGLPGGGTAASYRLSDSNVFIPEYIRTFGNYTTPPALADEYRCGAFGKWHLSGTSTDNICHPIDNQYNVFAGCLSNPYLPSANGDHVNWYHSAADDQGTAPNVCRIRDLGTNLQVWDATKTRQEARAWINAQGNNPFFAYVAFSPPHLPLQVPPMNGVSAATQLRLQRAELLTGCDYDSTVNWKPELAPGTPWVPAGACCTGTYTSPCGGAAVDCQTLRKYDRLIFRAMIENLDYEIGQLITGLPENTMIIVIGDNGTPNEVVQSLDMASLTPPQAQPACGTPYPNIHAKKTNYQLGIRVPLIVAGPRACRGGTCTNVVNGVDVFSTVAEIAGANHPPLAPSVGTAQPGEVDGISFLSLIENPTGPATRCYAFSEWAADVDCSLTVTDPCNSPGVSGNYTRALTDGRFKYIRNSAFSTAPNPVSYNFCSPTSYNEEFYQLIPITGGFTTDPNELTNRIHDTQTVMDVCSPTYTTLGAMRRVMNCLGGI